MEKLLALANKYGTDKGDSQPHYHGYADTYDTILSHLRDEPITMMEIGVADTRFPGASLRMWHDYFAHGTIMGIDIVDTAEFAASLERVETFQVDQSNRDALEAFCTVLWPQFDLIIDDGSHISEHQFVTLGVMFNQLKPGGIYIIEDVVSAAHNGAKILQWAKQYIDSNPEKPAEMLDYEWEYLLNHVASMELLHDGEIILIHKAVQ